MSLPDNNQAAEEERTEFHVLGAEPSVDYAHDAAARAAAIRSDVNKPDSQGRTLLHALCGYAWRDHLGLGPGLVKQTKWLLKRVRDVDAADHYGIRPLHIAAMMSEYLVKTLLAAGAQPDAATKEGLTPLHLAARARQSNIVGLLLGALQKTAAPGTVSAAINARDKYGYTALFHACRSGRQESVALLLEAGADVAARDEEVVDELRTWQPKVTRTAIVDLLSGCCEYAYEQRLWEGYGRPDYNTLCVIHQTMPPENWGNNVAAGMRVNDEHRPWVAAGFVIRQSILDAFRHGPELESTLNYALNNCHGGIRSDQDTTQIAPILRRLYRAYIKAHEAEPDFLPHPAFLQALKTSRERYKSATATPDEHTLRCFSDMESELDKLAESAESAESAKTTRPPELVLFSRRLVRDGDDAVTYDAKDDRKEPGIFVIPSDIQLAAERLLRQHDYRTLERQLTRLAAPVVLQHSYMGRPKMARILRFLVQQGEADLLHAVLDYNRDLLTPDEIQGTADANPLLYLACKRELPNMDVVRLLVDTYGVDLDGQSMTAEARERNREEQPPDCGAEDEEDPGHLTALHELARARNWWGVYEALPYLLQRGASLDVVNDEGETPLQMAENCLPPAVYREEVLKMMRDHSGKAEDKNLPSLPVRS